jgi:hypothetical protein
MTRLQSFFAVIAKTLIISIENLTKSWPDFIHFLLFTIFKEIITKIIILSIEIIIGIKKNYPEVSATESLDYEIGSTDLVLQMSV